MPADPGATVDGAVLGLMPHEVTLEPRSGHDRFGGEEYGAAITVNAQVIQRPSRMPSGDAETIRVSGKVVCDRVVASFGPDGRITLPDGSTPEVKAVSVWDDEHGDPHHMTIGLA